MNKKLLFVSAVAVLATLQGKAQTKIGDNPATINPDAILELESTNKGLLVPRVALTSASSAAPLSAHVAGMVVYNTATVGNVMPGYYFNDGTSWLRVADGAAVGATNGLTRLADSIQLGGTLGMPTILTTNGTNTLRIQANDIGGVSSEANQGFNVLSTATTNSDNAVALRGRVAHSGGTVGLLRGVTGVATLSAGGTVSGTSNGGYFSNQLAGGALGTNALMTAVSGDAEASSGTANASNAMVGGRFGAALSGSVAGGRAVGVLATAGGSTTANIGALSVINDPTLTGAPVLTLGGAVSGAGNGTAIAAINSNTAANNFALYADGNVRMRNLPASGSTALVGIDANGNLSTTTLSTAAATADNGLTKTGNNIQLGGALTQATTIAATGANNLKINADNVGGVTSEANQGFNVLATTTTDNDNAIALRGRLRQNSGTVGQVRGATGVVTLAGGTVSGSANGGYFNSQLAGGALGANALMTAVSGDVEATSGTANASNAMVGGRFGAALSGSVTSGRAIGVLATAGGSTTGNIGALSIINDPTLASTNVQNLGGAVTGANSGAAVAAINPITTGNNFALYADGNVALKNLPASGNTALIGINTTTGRLSTTAALPVILSQTATLDFPNAVARGGSQDLTVTVTGASAGDVVAIGIPNAVMTVPSQNFFAWVSAANTVSVRYINTRSTAVNPPAADFKIKVFK